MASSATHPHDPLIKLANYRPPAPITYPMYSICAVSFPAPNPRAGVWWHWNDFLAVWARDLTAMLCNRSRATCTLLHNGIQNRRAAFWLAIAKPKQLTLHNVTSQQDAISHENHRAAIWLACTKTKMLSLQEPRKRSNVTRPFPSQRVGSGDETMH